MILLNGKEVKFTSFPNGETKVDEESINSRFHSYMPNNIVFKYENDSDLIRLMFVKKHIDSLNANSFNKLTINYMPYSRMDRTEKQSVFTLKYVTEFINSLKFDFVVVIEPHSDVTSALLDRSLSMNVTFNILKDVMKEVEFNKDEDYLFFPDAGAQKRYGKETNLNQLVGFKQRDWSTGQIKSLDLVGEIPTKPFKVIIVDDLCSYGGTFIQSADKLAAAGASEIYLIVTHCENSIFNGRIFNDDSLIKKVFTTDTILTDEHYIEFFTKHNLLKVIKIEEAI